MSVLNYLGSKFYPILIFVYIKLQMLGLYKISYIYYYIEGLCELSIM